MRLINFRYFLSLRRLKYFIFALIVFTVFLNLHILRRNPSKRQSGLTKPWRFFSGILFTSLKTNVTCPTKIKFLILVSSNVGNFDRRSLIRRTWGTDYSIDSRWRTVFLISTNDNKGEMERLPVEERIYGDIVRSGYKESFFNMAFKVAFGFEWAVKFCEFDFLLKADDDTFVNTHGLLKYLQDKNTPRKGLYTGNPMVGSPVLRNGRYKVQYDTGEGRDDQLNKTFFAPYCSGGGFVLSKDVVELILDRFDFEHPLNIDDAYIGELAERAHVKMLVNSKNFLMYADSCQYNVQAYVQHPAKNKCLEKLFEQHTRYLATGELPTRPPTKPAKQPPKPAKQPPKPAKQPPKPAKQPPKPATQPPKPATQPPKPATQPPKPATQPPKPATQPPKPATQPPKPATQPPKPATQPPKPATQPPKVATQPPKHSTQPPRVATKPSKLTTQLP